MKFSIAIEHRKALLEYSVSAERDNIFIAFPKAKGNQRIEKIFLTKANNQWVGDCDDKKLIEKIGKEIDAARELKYKKSKLA